MPSKDNMHTTLRPKMAIITCSGGPTFRAIIARRGAVKRSARELINPPKAEAKVHRARQLPASPRKVMAFPSKEVGAEAGVPGIPKRMAGMEPPYTPPQYTPLKRRSAVAGSRAYEKGTKTATPIVAEKPGRAPKIMPSTIPPPHTRRFTGVQTPVIPIRIFSHMAE
jgi:hypothetical protein